MHASNILKMIEVTEKYFWQKKISVENLPERHIVFQLESFLNLKQRQELCLSSSQTYLFLRFTFNILKKYRLGISKYILYLVLKCYFFLKPLEVIDSSNKTNRRLVDIKGIAEELFSSTLVLLDKYARENSSVNPMIFEQLKYLNNLKCRALEFLEMRTLSNYFCSFNVTSGLPDNNNSGVLYYEVNLFSIDPEDGNPEIQYLQLESTEYSDAVKTNLEDDSCEINYNMSLAEMINSCPFVDQKNKDLNSAYIYMIQKARQEYLVDDFLMVQVQTVYELAMKYYFKIGKKNNAYKIENFILILQLTTAFLVTVSKNCLSIFSVAFFNHSQCSELFNFVTLKEILKMTNTTEIIQCLDDINVALTAIRRDFPEYFTVVLKNELKSLHILFVLVSQQNISNSLLLLIPNNKSYGKSSFKLNYSKELYPLEEQFSVSVLSEWRTGCRNFEEFFKESPSEICSICTEKIRTQINNGELLACLSSCRHVFCLKCIQNWFYHSGEIRNTCPECRQESSTHVRHTNFHLIKTLQQQNR